MYGKMQTLRDYSSSLLDKKVKRGTTIYSFGAAIVQPYINDIVDVVTEFEIQLFVDHT